MLRGVAFIALFVGCTLLCVAGQSPSIVTSTFDSTPMWGDWDYGAGDVVFVLTSSGRLYRSQSGSALVDISSSLPGWGEQRAPFNQGGVRGVAPSADPNRVYAFGYSNNWASTDAGASWSKIYWDEDFILASADADPANPDVLLVSSWTLSCYTTAQTNCHRRLYVTQNFGQSFELLAIYVQKYMWASSVSVSTPRIYATIYDAVAGNQLTMNPAEARLTLSDNYFATSRVLLANTSSFAVKGAFVDAGYYSAAGMPELYASGNYGKSFTTVNAPTWAYAVVLTPDVQSQMLFIAPTNMAPGTLHGLAYHSDYTGANLVLSQAAMAIDRLAGPEFHYDPALLGIFFTNVEVLGTSGTARRVTRVSRNNGGSWQSIPAPAVDSLGAPTNCDASQGCSLHLYLVMQADGSFVTHPSTPGLIVCLGNVGQYLATDRTQFNVYISNDAGSSWRELLKGPQSVSFAQYGSLVLAVSPTGLVQYSYDQGSSWSVVPSPGMGRLVWLESTPSNNSMVFIGLTYTNAYMITFPQSARPRCGSADFYTWSPVDPNGNACVLGRRAVVTSRKPQSQCLVQSLAPITGSITACPCSTADFECSPGYARQGGALAQPCLPVSPTARSTSPPAPHQRLISGDVCQ